LNELLIIGLLCLAIVVQFLSNSFVEMLVEPAIYHRSVIHSGLKFLTLYLI